MSVYRTNEMFRASGLTLNSSSDTVTAGTVNGVTGATGPFDISEISVGMLVVNAAGAPTGTDPGLAVFVDCQDYFGNWCLVSHFTAISGAVLTSAGLVFGSIPASGYQLLDKARIRWVLTGTTPVFPTVSFSLYGR